MLFIQSICLLQSHLNHLLSLGELSASPDRHSITTVGFPEHSSNFIDSSCFAILCVFILSMGSDHFKAFLAQRFFHHRLDGICKTDTSAGVILPSEEDVSQIGLHVTVLISIGHFLNHDAL